MEIKFEDNSNAFLEALADSVKPRALTRIGNQAEGYAKDLCLVDTGRLRNSIANRVGDDYVDVGTNVSYAITVETGAKPSDRKDPSEDVELPSRPHEKGKIPSPFLKPAVANHQQTYRNIIEDEMKNA